MKDSVLKELFDLPPKERVRLAKVLLKSVDDGPKLTEYEKKILDERLADDDANPDDTVTWEEAKATLKPRSRSKR
jgi:putative addiction module component (TIGR02574 family)